MKSMDRMDRLLATAERFMVVLLFALLLLLMTANILARNTGRYLPQQVLALVPHCVMWIALFGSTLALREKRHIAFNALTRWLPVRIGRRIDRFTAFFAFVVTAGLFIAALGFVRAEIQQFGASGWMTAIFPFFFFSAAFRCFLSIIAADRVSAAGQAGHDSHTLSGTG